MRKDYAVEADWLKPYIVPWIAAAVASTGAPSASAGAGGALTAHELNGPYHLGTLNRSQAPWVATDISAAIASHAALPDVHHARQHSIIGGDHTVTGAALDIVGLTAPNALGILTPSSSPGAVSAILKSSAAGNLTLPTFTASTKLTSPLIDTASGNLTLQPTGSFVKLAASKGIESNGTFASGFTGSGMRLDDGITKAGKTSIEADNLTIRGTMRVYELVIQQIRMTNGSLLVSSAGKVKAVSGAGPYTVTTDGQHGLAVNDLILAQRWNPTQGALTGTYIYRSALRVTAITTVGTDWQFTATLLEGDAPIEGAEYGRIGNTTDTNRQGGIYLTSDDSYAPYIDIYNDVDSLADWTGAAKLKARIGRLDGISDAVLNPTGYGLYSANVFLKGVVSAANDVVRLDSTGARVKATTASAFASTNAYRLTNASGAEMGGLYGRDYTSAHTIGVQALGDASHSALAALTSTGANASGAATTFMEARNSAGTKVSSVTVDVTNAASYILFGAADYAQFNMQTRSIGGHRPLTDLGASLGEASYRWGTVYANQIIATTISGTTMSGAEWEYAGNMVIDANSASANTTVSIVNQAAGAWVANLAVEGSITSGGTAVSLSGHNHNDLYFTEAESDARYVQTATLSGYLLASGATVGATSQAQVFTEDLITNSRLGIGKTPATSIDVNGNGNLRLASNASSSTSKNGRLTVQHYNSSEEDVLAFLGTITNNSNIIFFGGGSSTANTATRMQFFVASNNVTTTGTEIMRLTPEGVSVATGTTAATIIDALDTNATTDAVQNAVTLRSTNAGTPDVGFGVGIRASLKSTTSENQSAGRLTWEWVTPTHGSRAAIGKLSAYYTATERVAVTWQATSSSVQVGINQTSPTYTLDVAGTARATGIIYAGSDIEMTGELLAANGSASVPSVAALSDTNTGLYWSAADTLAITTGGTQRATFSSTGTSVTGSVTASTSVIAPTVTTASGDLTLTSVGGTVAITGALTVSTTATITGVTSIASGSVGAPGLTFTGDTNSGIYRSGADAFSLVAGGTAIINVGATGAGINVAYDSTAALKVQSVANDDITLFLKQKSGQTARMWRVEDSAGQELIVLDSTGNLQSGNPGFYSGLTGWQITPNGNAEFNNITARGELHASIFVMDEFHASGGTLVVAPAGKLELDATVYTTTGVEQVLDLRTTSVSGSGTQLDIRTTSGSGSGSQLTVRWIENYFEITDPPSGHATIFAAGDTLRCKASGNPGAGIDLYDIWGTVGRVEDMTDYYRYYYHRQSGGSNGIVIPAGTAIISYGAEGDGRILLTADQNYAPYIDIFTSGATPWTGDITPHTRLGRLDGVGLPGVSGIEQYGMVTGTDLSDATAPYIVNSNLQMFSYNVDSEWNNGNPTARITSGGVFKLGTDIDSATTTGLDFNPQTGNLTLGSNGGAIVLEGDGDSYFSGVMTIGTSGGIYQGTGTFASPTTGLKIWNDTGAGRIGGYNSGTVQWYANTDGKLYAGAGNALLDSNGISVIGTGVFRIMENSSTLKGYIYSSNPLDSLLANTTGVGVKTNGSATSESVSLRANASGGRSSEIAIEATGSSGTNRVRMIAYSGSGSTSGQMTLGESSFTLALNGTSTTDFSVDGSGNVVIGGSLDMSGNDIIDANNMMGVRSTAAL